MKAFLAIVFVCVIVAVQGLTDIQKEKLKQHQSECVVESGVEMASLEKLRKGDYTTDNDALKKFALCMMIKSELMTKEGKFKKDIALAKVQAEEDKEAVEKLIDACLLNKGNTPEQTAWNYVKCYHEKNPKHPIM